MKLRTFLVGSAVAVSLLSVTSTVPVRSEPAAGAGRIPRGEIIVKFRAGASERDIASAHSRSRAAVRFRSRRTGWQAIVLPPGADTEAALRRYRMDLAVERAEFAAPRRITKVPDDLLKGQWGFHNTGQTVAQCCKRFVCKPCGADKGTVVAKGQPDADIDAPEAWSLAKGSTGIVVAVLDTGIDPLRKDLGERLVPGYDFVNGDDDPDDDHGHGTAVASIIGAVGNNGAGMTGLNWAVSIMPVKVCSPRGECPTSSVLAGIEYAADNGAHVISMSLACDEHQDPNSRACTAYLPGTCYVEAEKEVIEQVLAEGVVVVEAAGNCGQNLDDETTAYPCAHGLRGNICAAATDINDSRASFSNFGPRTAEIAAPGADILVYALSESGGYHFWSGTSFATPMTSGAAALLLSRTPLTPDAVQDRIVGGGDPKVTYAARGGRLNAYNMVADVFLPGRVYSTEPPGEVNLIADVNGDRRGDLLRGSAGAGFQVSINSRKKKIFKPSRPWSPADPAEVVLAGDVNGDGREDLILVGAAGHQVLRAGRSISRPLETWNADPGSGAYTAGDLDGDGRIDLLRHDGAFEALLSTGAAFAAPQVWSASSAGGFFIAADVNGDRFDDLVNILDSGAFKSVEVSLSNGVSFTAANRWLSLLAGLAPAGAGDFDGDGFEDLLVVDPATFCLEVVRSTGSSFETPRPWSCPGAVSMLMTGRASARPDLRADLVVLTTAGSWELLQSRR